MEQKTNPARNPEFKIFDLEPGLGPKTRKKTGPAAISGHRQGYSHGVGFSGVFNQNPKLLALQG